MQKKLFILLLAALPLFGSFTQATEEYIGDEELSALLNSDDSIESEDVIDFEDEELDLSRRRNPRRPRIGPRRPYPRRPHWEFYGCFRHRRYCTRSAQSAGYAQVRAELGDSYCAPNAPWGCYVLSR